MERTIVIKARHIGSTKDTTAKTPKKNSGPLYKVLPLDPKTGITGRPLEDLRPGDVMFLSGSEQHIIIKDITVKYIEDFPTDEIYIRGMDGSTHLLSEFVVINEPASGATENTATEPVQNNPEVFYKVVPANTQCIVGRRPQDLRAGDMVFPACGRIPTYITKVRLHPGIPGIRPSEYLVEATDGITYSLNELTAVHKTFVVNFSFDSSSPDVKPSTTGEPKFITATDDDGAGNVSAEGYPLAPNECEPYKPVGANKFVKYIPSYTEIIGSMPFSGLSCGDVFFCNGRPVLIMMTPYHRDTHFVWGSNMDSYTAEDADLIDENTVFINELAEAPQVDVQETSKVSIAPASESEVEARIIKVIKHGTNTISGIPLLELDWGDTFFVHGIPYVNYTETLSGLKRNLSGFLGKAFSFDDVDAYEATEAPQVDTQDTVRNAGPSESRESDTTIPNDSRIVKGVKKGSAALTGILFRDLKAGDIFFRNGEPVTVAVGAHKSCDDYVVCDRDGKSYFFEDADLHTFEDMAKNVDYDRVVKVIKNRDGVIRGCLYRELKPGDFFFYREHRFEVKDFAGTFVGSDGTQYCDIVRNYANWPYLPEEMEPYVPEKARGDRIFVKREDTLCSIFSRSLNVGDVVTAINVDALREEDFDRCAIVRRDGALATITVSDLQVNDKVLALL